MPLIVLQGVPKFDGVRATCFACTCFEDCDEVPESKLIISNPTQSARMQVLNQTPETFASRLSQVLKYSEPTWDEAV